VSQERGKILIVDDDDDMVAMLEAVLGVDFDVLTARDAQEALGQLGAQRVAGVIADHMLPGMSGIELLDGALVMQPQAARVLITASDRINVLRDAINEARVHRFLSKPLRLHELPTLVGEAIREAQLEAENARLVDELSQKNAELARANERLELEVAARTRELHVAIAELEQLALRDGLTGLFNHRYFQECLEVELSRAGRHAHSVSLLFIDVDHFKHYNDTHGHPAGDKLLRKIASVLVGGGESGLPLSTRKSDVAARYGGEEFVMLLPETSLEGALIKAERLRACVAGYRFENAQTQPLGLVSISIGVASFPEHGHDKQSLIAAADRMLYRAKHEGRNRVCHPEVSGAS
jgi:two-component system, cell cycle response regulator